MKLSTLATALLSALTTAHAQIIQTTPPAWSDVAPCATQCFTGNFPTSAVSSELYHPCATTTGFVRCLDNYCPGDYTAYNGAVSVLSSICTYLTHCSFIPYKCQGYPNAGPGWVPSTTTTSSSSTSKSTVPPSTTSSGETVVTTSGGTGSRRTSTVTVTYTSTIECCC